MTRIKVLDDQPFSDLLVSLAGESEKVKDILDHNYNPPLEPGTIIEGVTIDRRERATFIRTDCGEPWYLPKGWYEIIEEDEET